MQIDKETAERIAVAHNVTMRSLESQVRAYLERRGNGPLTASLVNDLVGLLVMQSDLKLTELLFQDK